MNFKRPESVLVVIYTAGGACLLLRRVSPPDFWQSVTGSLEWGESPDAAAARELREETGLAAAGLVNEKRVFEFPIIEPWKLRYAPEAHLNTEHVYSLRLAQALTPKLNPEEHLEFQWLSKTEAISRVSSWSNRRAIELLTPGC